ncbi:MAG TPA: flagellar basal body L-ring protein FlgH [Nevskiaceae bacterium]|nr:flagellar basal body L-ring protein FlgH [Nevskiaceae bacterium]
MSRCLLLAVLLLGGCASRGTPAPAPAAVSPGPPVESRLPGAIYGAATANAWFEDRKARRVGDVLTVLLVERTDAQKSVSSSLNRSSETRIDNPTLFGRPLTRGGTPLFDFGLGGSSEFSGGGDAAQSNKLQGSVSVLVEQVLPNGHLVIAGAKELELNQGRETVQLRGVVRPADIRADNSITSDRVANAEIRYSGEGSLSAANRAGWLTRFFASPLWPF